MEAYLAGPDVFLPDAREHARRKVEICARHGIVGRPPLNEDVDSLRAMPDEEALYRPRFVRHRVVACAARAAVEIWSCRTALGGRNPCRSISHVAL